MRSCQRHDGKTDEGHNLKGRSLGPLIRTYEAGHKKEPISKLLLGLGHQHDSVYAVP